MLQSRFVQLSRLRVHCVVVGSGPLLMLLHGFPDTWRTWRRQFEALASRFTVVAPDLPGYGQSDKLPNVRDYRNDLVGNDLLELAASFSAEPFCLAGHDWGGAIAWSLAARVPERLRRVAILNCPHPAALARHLRRNPVQMTRSLYMAFFQLPWLPERLLRSRLPDWLPGNAPGLADRSKFEPQDVADTAAELAQPGRLRSMLNLYRAAARHGAGPLPSITLPTLLLWGQLDTYLTLPTALESLQVPCVAGPTRLTLWPRAGHWVQFDADAEVNQQLLDFFCEGSVEA